MLPGFRFRKSFTLLPGIKINLSKSGVSTSVGKKGATVNLSSKGTTGSVGVPGTGMSYRKQLAKGGKGYYGFLAVMLVFYVIYLFHTGQLNKYLPQQQPSAIPEQLRDAPQDNSSNPYKTPPRHRSRHVNHSGH